MSPDRSSKYIARAFIALAIFVALLILWGIYSATDECQDQDGDYVQTTTGYRCIGADDE